MRQVVKREPIIDALRAVNAQPDEPQQDPGPGAYAPPAVRERLEAEELEQGMAAQVATVVATVTPSPPLAMVPDKAGELAGKTIELACEASAQRVLALCRQVQDLAATTVRDGEVFAKSVRDIGQAWEQRIVDTMASMRASQEIIQAERERVAKLFGTPVSPQS